MSCKYILLVNFILLCYDIIFWFVEPSCLTYRIFAYGSNFILLIILILYCIFADADNVKITLILFFCVNVHLLVEAVCKFNFVQPDCDISPTICVFTGFWMSLLFCCKKSDACEDGFIYVSIV
jgi:hypothetical protein